MGARPNGSGRERSSPNRLPSVPGVRLVTLTHASMVRLVATSRRTCLRRRVSLRLKCPAAPRKHLWPPEHSQADIGMYLLSATRSCRGWCTESLHFSRHQPQPTRAARLCYRSIRGLGSESLEKRRLKHLPSDSTGAIRDVCFHKPFGPQGDTITLARAARHEGLIRETHKMPVESRHSRQSLRCWRVCR